MKEGGSYWKVGLFLFVGLVLLAVLMLNFSKGVSPWKPKYVLRLKTSNVGGIKAQAQVLRSGVEIGKVSEIGLAEDGKSVYIFLKIYQRYKIHSDARFSIDSMGFLGDKYVAITPKNFEGRVLQNGDEVLADEPFDLQEAAKAAAGLIQRVDQTARRLNDAIARIDRIVLNEQTLTNITVAIANFRSVSERAMETVEGLDNIFQTNSPPLQLTLSNLVHFSEQLNGVGGDLRELIATNRSDISIAVHHLQTASESARDVMADVRAGKGLVGGLLKDETIRTDLAELMSNLNTLSSNLNKYGLLYKPKKPKTETQREPIYPGKHP